MQIYEHPYRVTASLGNKTRERQPSRNARVTAKPGNKGKTVSAQQEY